MKKNSDYEKAYRDMGIVPNESNQQTYFHKFSLLKDVPVTTTPDFSISICGDEK